MTQARRTRSAGLLYGLGAYGLWGMFPAFFPLLEPAGAVEILAHRIVWTLVFMIVVVAAAGRLGDLREISRRSWLLLVLAAGLIAANWVIYIYAVNNGHIVDAALGYFISPLVSVAIGVLFFAERLNRMQSVALTIAVVAVTVLGIETGALPMIALGLAFSFGLYGAVKKVLDTDPRVSVGIEAAVAAPLALAFMAVAQATGQATFAANGPWHAVLLMLSGPVTAIPLLLFAAAVQRLQLVSLGLLMYLTPAMQMTWGVLVGHEPMRPLRWLGFALIWVALAVFTGDALRRAGADRAAARLPDA